MDTHSQSSGNIAYTNTGRLPPNLLDPKLPYTSWREGQEECMEVLFSWLQGGDRFLGMEAPTGAGKSLLSVALGLLGERKTAILTHSLALQDQLYQDYPAALRDTRGMQHSPCLMGKPGQVAADGRCQLGMECALKSRGCVHFDQFRWARQGMVLSTNYAMLLTHGTTPRNGGRDDLDGLGYRELLICDEAHLAFDAIVSHAEVRIIREVMEWAGVRFPDLGFDELGQWQDWARVIDRDLLTAAAALRISRDPWKAKPVMDLQRQLEEFTHTDGSWAFERTPSATQWTLTPVWPAEHSSRLFRGVGKVLLMSASLTTRTLDLLGVPWQERQWYSAPSTFPAANTPIRHINTIDCKYANFNGPGAEANIAHWVSRIDQIIRSRPGTKGLVFTTSYGRADMVVSRSEFKGQMMRHDRGSAALKTAADAWKVAPAPSVLVSPTATSGWDFPEADWIVIAKVPYPVTQTGAAKIRAQEDKEWTSYTAMETIVQAAGRGTRSAQDKCEVFIIDDAWQGLWRRYKHFAPGWFSERVLPEMAYVPPPGGG